ncbi:hypothetical protein SAMN05720764_11420 [Fibrobacter sp. UWH5]|nr:hypothetical protein SAMN05720764_11420 [Fibrobacter sp. UWH5]
MRYEMSSLFFGFMLVAVWYVSGIGNRLSV